MKIRFASITLLLLCSLQAIAQLSAPQPRVQAELIGGPSPDGQSHLLGLTLTPEPGWHTYWQNAGDAGLGTRLRWSAPEGVHIGPTLWPTPKAYAEGDLMTYGYGETHTLLNRVELSPELPDDTSIQLKARWLVCKDICIPESADLEVQLGELRGEIHASWLREALQAVPEQLGIGGQFATRDGHLAVAIHLPPDWYAQASALQWFPAASGLIEHAPAARWFRHADGLMVENPLAHGFEPPDGLSGVLVIEDPLGRRAVQVDLVPGPLPEAIDALGMGEAAGPAGALSLWLALLMAFAGGIILNLMPCVFPVLTLKAMSLTRAESAAARRAESLFYSAGVIISFLLIAALLLALRAGGAALGWGFQLQNPVVVAALAVLMFILGLAMLGWTQLGMRFMGWGQNLSAQSGHRGAFFTGVLAVLVASPCSAPFMGGALGYAVLQPAPVALAIFAALGLGLAFPFVLLAWTPALARRLPRPGPWMETLKHWMALPLILTGVWLAWVLWRQAGDMALVLLLTSTALIAAGIRQVPQGWQLPRIPARIAIVAGLALIASPLVLETDPHQEVVEGRWQPWSEAAVDAARDEGRGVFVDFTADWCLSCIVNERAVLNTAEIQSLFESRNTLLLKADWTQYDPAITEALARFGRNGVPLYLYYPTDGREAKVLPQILTPGIVRAAVEG